MGEAATRLGGCEKVKELIGGKVQGCYVGGEEGVVVGGGGGGGRRGGRKDEAEGQGCNEFERGTLCLVVSLQFERGATSCVPPLFFSRNNVSR